MSATAEQIGRRLRRAREGRCLSLRQLGEKSGVGFNTISRLERGEDAWFSRVRALARALALSLDALTAEPSCVVCDESPPAGFTCQSCGTKGSEVAP